MVSNVSGSRNHLRAHDCKYWNDILSMKRSCVFVLGKCLACQSMVHDPAASWLLGVRVVLEVKISDPTPDFQSQNVRLARSSTNAYAHEKLSCAMVQTPSNSKFCRTKRWVSSLGHASWSGGSLLSGSLPSTPSKRAHLIELVRIGAKCSEHTCQADGPRWVAPLAVSTSLGTKPASPAAVLGTGMMNCSSWDV